MCHLPTNACAFRHDADYDFRMTFPAADFLDLSDFDGDPEFVGKFCDRLAIAFVSGSKKMVQDLQRVSRQTECVIVVTLGPEGSCALVRGETVYEAATIVSRPVDSTGCGDAFQAAFTVSYWLDHNLRDAMQNGARLAANVIRHLGAVN